MARQKCAKRTSDGRQTCHRAQPFGAGNDLGLALERGMALRPIHDHPLLGLVLGLIQRERCADHVAGDLLAPFGIANVYAHLIVHEEAAVLPAQQLGHQGLVDGLVCQQHLQHGPSKLRRASLPHGAITRSDIRLADAGPCSASPKIPPVDATARS